MGSVSIRQRCLYAPTCSPVPGHEPASKCKGGQGLCWPYPEPWHCTPQSAPEAGVWLGGFLSRLSARYRIWSALASSWERTARTGSGALGCWETFCLRLWNSRLLFCFFSVGDAEARLPPAGFLKFYFMRTVGYDSPSAVKVNVIVALRLCSFL